MEEWSVSGVGDEFFYEKLLDRPPPHGGLAVPYNDDEPQLVISVEELVRAESRVCEVLELDMAMPVASEFLFVLLQRLRWPAAYSVHRGAHARVAMVAQMYCELAAHLEESIGAPPSLVASAALCAALARLRCGLWSEGAASTTRTATPAAAAAATAAARRRTTSPRSPPCGSTRRSSGCGGNLRTSDSSARCSRRRRPTREGAAGFERGESQLLYA